MAPPEAAMALATETSLSPWSKARLASQANSATVTTMAAPEPILEALSQVLPVRLLRLLAQRSDIRETSMRPFSHSAYQGERTPEPSIIFSATLFEARKRSAAAEMKPPAHLPCSSSINALAPTVFTCRL